MFKDLLKKICITSAIVAIHSNANCEVDLNGVDEKVEIPNSSIYNKADKGGYTVECSIKTIDTNGVAVSRIDERGHGFILGVKNGRYLARIVNEGIDKLMVADSHGPLINDNKWHYISFTIKPSTSPNSPAIASFYVDGATIMSGLSFPFLDKAWNSSQPLTIGWADAYGHSNGANVGYFKGKIKAVRIWKKALPMTAIRTNSTLESINNPENHESLVAEFRLKNTDNKMKDFSKTGATAKLISKNIAIKTISVNDPETITVAAIEGVLRGCHSKTIVSTNNLRKITTINKAGDYAYHNPSAGKIYISITAALRKGYSVSTSDYELVTGTTKIKCQTIKKYKSEAFAEGSASIINKSSDKLIFVLLFEVSPKASKYELVSNLKTTIPLNPLKFKLVN